MPFQSWFHLERIPEPEVMDDRDGVEAYSATAAQAYLERIDRTFVDQALSLGVTEGHALDIGTGPGLIPIKLAASLPRLRLTGVDLSAAMLQKAHDEPPRKPEWLTGSNSGWEMPNPCPFPSGASTWCSAILCCTTCPTPWRCSTKSPG